MKKEWIPNPGDWVTAVDSRANLKIGKTIQVVFAGLHEGNIKLLDDELTKKYPEKEGWYYIDSFVPAKPEDIPNSTYEIC